MVPKDTRRVKRALKEKTPEKIQPKTLLIAALTAMTVATISLQLTGMVSSITLVALASLLTAFVSEFYRVGLELFHRAVSKQVEKTIGITAPPVVEIVEVSEPQGPDLARQLTPLHLRWRLRRVLASRWAVPIIFSVVAFATVAGSYSVGHFTGSDPITFNREVVQVKDLSSDRMRELKASAKAEAEKAAAKEGEEILAQATGDASELVYLTKEELIALITTLEDELAKAEVVAGEQKASMEELTDRLLTLETTLATLQERLDLLEETLTEEPTPTDPVTPTPTDPPQE